VNKVPTKEEAIGFVRKAIDQYNKDKDKPNKISIYNEHGPYKNSGKAKEFSHALYFQTPNMHNLLKIPENNPEEEGHYYKYCFRATDGGTMKWSFSLESNNADDDMREIMESIARESITKGMCSNPKCINRISEKKHR
jgi:hypothetical protein